MANEVRFNDELPLVVASDSLWRRSRGSMRCGTRSLIHGSTWYSNGRFPKYLQRGQGARVWDVDGNEYLDLEMGSGSLILGYCHPQVDSAVREQLGDGITFSLMHPLAVEVAELMCATIPHAECVIFSKSGADMVNTAVRQARAFTGREKVVCCNYQGGHHGYSAHGRSNRSVVDTADAATSVFDYGDLESLLAVVDRATACIIIEPLTMQIAEPGFLEVVREVCDRFGALLIFDETWTGFRCALGGAQEYLNVRADLAFFSRAIANGMCLAALTGRNDVMQRVEHDDDGLTTHCGEALSLAATKACIQFMRDNPVVEYIEHVGAMFMFEVKCTLATLDLQDYVRVVGHPFRSELQFEYPGVRPDLLRGFVQQELLQRGILWSGKHNLSFSHTEADIDYVAIAITEALTALREAMQCGDIHTWGRNALSHAVLKSPDQTGSRSMACVKQRHGPRATAR